MDLTEEQKESHRAEAEAEAARELKKHTDRGGCICGCWQCRGCDGDGWR